MKMPDRQGNAPGSRSTPTQRRWRSWNQIFRRVRRGADGVAQVGGRQIYILPTRNGLRFGAILFVMLLGSLNYQNNLGLLITFFLASVALIAMHHTWFNLLGLGVRVKNGSPVFVGEEAVFEVILLHAGKRVRRDIAILESSGRRQSTLVPVMGQASLQVARTATRRGLLRLGEIRIETAHPMHLFRAWCYITTEAATLIYPEPAVWAPEPGEAGGDADTPRHTSRDGTEDYLGPRGYRDGDSPKQIDWKAFARERGLVVKQFGGEHGQEIWIDWSGVSASDPETRIGLLTRQVLDAAQAGIRFGLRVPDGQEALDRGPHHLRRCLTRLALLQIAPTP